MVFRWGLGLVGDEGVGAVLVIRCVLVCVGGDEEGRWEVECKCPSLGMLPEGGVELIRLV